MQALAAWRERVGAVRRGWEKREAERDELIYDFFEDGLIPDLVMLTPDTEAHLSTKHHKKIGWPYSISLHPSPSIQPNKS
jgi:hypothetical protein